MNAHEQLMSSRLFQYIIPEFWVSLPKVKSSISWAISCVTPHKFALQSAYNDDCTAETPFPFYVELCDCIPTNYEWHPSFIFTRLGPGSMELNESFGQKTWRVVYLYLGIVNRLYKFYDMLIYIYFYLQPPSCFIVFGLILLPIFCFPRRFLVFLSSLTP